MALTPALTTISRRGFLFGCAAAAFVGSRISEVVFASEAAALADQGDVIITVFLRGGWDVMNVVPPIDGIDRGVYEAARPNLKIANQGNDAALRLNDQFGLHPAMTHLYDLYQGQKLSIIHAVGLNVDTRSHFEAQQYIETATPGIKSTGTGWVGRHLTSLGESLNGALMPAVAAGGALHASGAQTFQAIDVIQRASSSAYQPANGATYPNGGFGSNLKTIAKLIKLGVGLRAATVDLGGWDTHQAEGDGSGGYLSHLVGELSSGLAAFYTDLDESGSPTYADRMTLVVVSEFGRRLSENASRGTDHGHGSGIFVLGGQVNGGRVITNWPGLQNEQLYDRADLAVTIDYRQVLSEILVRRLGNAKLGAVFSGYKDYRP